MDIGCFSHTLDHAGEKMATPHLEKFMKSWVSLFAQCPLTNCIKSHFFGDMIPAFVNGDQIAENTARKVQYILNDQQKLPLLTVELAITVDDMKPFV